jgi:hypothetical protein
VTLCKLLGGLAAFILTVPLMADEIYTYTGPEYDVCSGVYATAHTSTCASDHFLTISFELSSPLGTGLVGDDIPAGDLIAWSFTDQTQTVSSTLGNLLTPSALEIDVTTNGSGAIIDWVLQASDSAAALESFGHISPPPGSSASTDVTYLALPLYENTGGQCFGCTVGTWVASTPGTPGVPEPGNVALVGFGLVAIGVVRQRLQRGKA